MMSDQHGKTDDIEHIQHDATVDVSIAFSRKLLDRAQAAAHEGRISLDRLIELALDRLLESAASRADGTEVDSTLDIGPLQSHRDTPTGHKHQYGIGQARAIKQGDIYWIPVSAGGDGELGYHTHPYVIVQEDALNNSRVNSVVVCALTSSIRLASEPGNVLLDPGEGALPKQSVVVVSKVSTVDKTQLAIYIGSLSKPRVEQVLAGMRFLQRAFFSR